MDLKFTFGGAAPDQHDHGAAPSGISLPITAKPVSLGPASSVLEISVRRAETALIAEAISGDGVTYARAEVALAAGTAPSGEPTPDTLAKAVRSAVSRVVAGLDGPLAESVTGLVLDLGADAADVLAALGMDPAAPTVDAALQRRAGIAMGTPVRISG
ncbi:hypothetical protein EDF60_0863 [Leucobacter luti]|uniref:hypothetical protein n=1 Tax=Leucobacter luti TaxID=340320 RepID=UPI00105180A4|nr:hypothetical protein [Leucobacter luti]MCW2288208.1 hypothetical protein [Leucobacter luti]TCK45633.1 hypothetical protein EDF60_0863 [Leucobacter luti]